MVYSVLLHKVNLAVKIKSKVISIRHSRKLLEKKILFFRKEATRNFSSYFMFKDEHDALSYGLDHHIPGNVTRNEINTEFELFYQNIVTDVSDLPEHNIDRTKTKLKVH